MRRRSTSNNSRGVLLIVILSAILFASTPSSQAALPDPLVIAQGIDATIIDPPRMTGQTTQNIIFHMFDQLVRLSPKGELVPWLAKSWEQKDPTTMVFHLRQNVLFHNGEKFGADDVKFSLERYIDAQLPGKTLAKTLKSQGQFAEAVIIDEYTVAIKTKKPAPILLPVLDRFAMMPKGYYSKIDPQTALLKPVGSGAYKFKEWIKDEKFVLEANENYWLGKPVVNTMIWRPIPEVGTRISALKTGEVHVISDVPPDLRKSLATDTTRVSFTPGLRMMYTGIVMNDPQLPTFDKRVRQAMNYAIDKNAITESIFHGLTKAYDGELPGPGQDAAVKAYPYDPVKAKTLLKEAGFPNGFKIEMASPNGRNLKDVETAQVVATYLGQVGIKVKLGVYDWVTYARLMKTKKATWKLYFMGQGGWSTLLQTLGRTFDKRQSPWALHGWDNPRFFELFDSAAAEPDRQLYINNLKEVQRMLWDECPWIFLYHQPLIYGVNKAVNWDISPYGDVLFHMTLLPEAEALLKQ